MVRSLDERTTTGSLIVKRRGGEGKQFCGQTQKNLLTEGASRV